MTTGPLTQYLLDEATQGDEIEAPTHYTSHPSGVECKDIAQEYSYNVGTAMAYLWRHCDKHDDPTIDIRKAMKHLQFELDRYAKIKGV